MIHGLPAGYSARTVLPADAEAVFAVVEASDIRLTGAPDYTLADVADDLADPERGHPETVFSMGCNSEDSIGRELLRASGYEMTLYTSVGMRPVLRIDAWERVLPAG